MTAFQRQRAVAGVPTASMPCEACESRPFSICGAIDEQDLARLDAASVQIDVSPGKTFMEEGEPAGDFFNVTAGTARLFKLLPDGRRQIIGFAGPGHFLGLATSGVFVATGSGAQGCECRDAPSAYTVSAEAIGPVRLCRFSRSALRELMDDFPQFEDRLLETAANELVAAQEQMVLLGRKTARERLASFLIAQSARAMPCRSPASSVVLPMTRGDIADYLGLTIETVSRTLTRLRTEKLIALRDSAHVDLLDRPALEKLAGGFG